MNIKRLLILILTTLIISAGLLFAEKRKIIDFSLMEIEDDKIEIAGKEQNKSTMIDFSETAGVAYSEEDKKEMIASLDLDQWQIVLASSSRNMTNMKYSFTKSVASKKYGKVLGARIHFPIGAFNSWAIIKPAFEIPAYSTPTKVEDDGSIRNWNDQEILAAQEQLKSDGKIPGDEGWVSYNSKFNEKGILKNVGIIKDVTISVYGENYPHGVGVRFKNHKEEIQDVFLGYLNHEGWKELTWKNSNYIIDVRNRELKTEPLYPFATPHIKLIGIIIYRDAASMGGDFVVYVKDIAVTYDLAIRTQERDIEDEEEWGILTAREKARRMAEAKRVGNMQVLRFLESKKMHQDTEIEEVDK